MGLLSWVFRSSDPKPAPPVVLTANGEVRGRNYKIDDGRTVRGFLGVPFAKPPIGNLRFQKPFPPDNWHRVRDCVKHAPKAEQKEIPIEKLIFTRVGRSEDCLYLNIFTPAWLPPSSQPKGFAVMIFIHGGAFAVHSSSYYGDVDICRCLCDKDVIVVTIQYRLGILGFAATGDSSCTPNLGLWDQAQALRWITENISYFDGNNQNITLFGQSAGGASVDYLLMSPHTNDLFQKAIAMGGSAYCPWAFSDQISIRDALRYRAKLLGWRPPADAASDLETNIHLMTFLRAQPGRKLGIELSVMGKSKKERGLYGADFLPVMGDEFLPGTYAELRAKAPKMPCIAGVTECEGLLFAAFRERNYTYANMERWLQAVCLKRTSNVRKTIANLYMNGSEKKRDQIKAFVTFYGDLLVNNGVHGFAEDMVETGHTVYLYNFEFCPRSLGPLGWMLPFTAATHGSELPYLFGRPIVSEYRFHDADRRVLELFSKMFTNFAKIDDPNVEGLPRWEPLTKDSVWRYMNINESCEMRDGFKGRRAALWGADAAESVVSDMSTQKETPLPLSFQ